MKQLIVILVLLSLISCISATNFTMIVLPDTQNYAESYPEFFINQTQWVIDNKDDLNIVMVMHLGDIVQNYDNVTQWKRANISMSVLDNIVPWSVLPGNHDMLGTTGTTDLYNSTFPASRFINYEWYGGSFTPSNRNNYQIIDNYVILNMEFCPSNSIINWANDTLQNYTNKKVIIVTHMYMDKYTTRNIGGCIDYKDRSAGCENCGKEIYQKLVVPNNNVFMTLNGHVHEQHHNTTRIDNRIVHQIVSNYQECDNGGNGWLRILKFVPQYNEIHVSTYSPYLDEYDTTKNNEFILYMNTTKYGDLTKKNTSPLQIGCILFCAMFAGFFMYKKIKNKRKKEVL